MDERTEMAIKIANVMESKSLFGGAKKEECAFEIVDILIAEGFSRRPEPLVRGMEIDVDAFAKDMFEVCHYPAPEYWKDQDENTKSRWRTNAEIIRDKAHVWLKEVGGE